MYFLAHLCPTLFRHARYKYHRALDINFSYIQCLVWTLYLHARYRYHRAMDINFSYIQCLVWTKEVYLYLFLKKLVNKKTKFYFKTYGIGNKFDINLKTYRNQTICFQNIIRRVAWYLRYNITSWFSLVINLYSQVGLSLFSEHAYVD